MFQFNKQAVAKKNLDAMLKSASRLKKLINSASGWGDYCIMLDSYVRALIEYKKNFNTSQASDEQINQLKLHDRDIWLISNYIKKLPGMFIEDLEAEIKRLNDEMEAPKESEL